MTETAKHSPAPWRCTPNGYILPAEIEPGDQCYVPIAEIRGYTENKERYGEKKAQAIKDANGRLIATAPELLDVARKLIAYHEAESDDDMNDWELQKMYDAVIVAAQDALAKAEPGPDCPS